MKKSDKPLVVSDLVKSIKEAKSVTVINYQGLPNKAAGELRDAIRNVGGTYVVAKNTLVKRALKDAGYEPDESATEGLNGPTAVVFANTDEIAPLQLIGKSIKETEFPKLKFGIFNNEFFNAVNLLALSKLPSKNILYGQLLSTLSGPAYGLVGTLNANLQMLVYVLDQRSKQTATQ